jgi:hypothetical protein
MARTIFKDNKGRNLREGERQKKDGRYEYRYRDIYGIMRSVYSWRLTKADPQPQGKRQCKCLRDLEEEIKRDLHDGIDTYLESTNNDISPFKAIMNDMYAKDISKKIKSVFREKQKSGQFLGSIAPYGYKLSENEKGKLEIDEYSAEIVREIFQMYVNGYGSIDIMNHLNSKGILNPSSYHKTKYKTKQSTTWNQITILAI